MSKITLAILSPDKETAERLIRTYGRYFDATVVELAPDCDNFAKARNKMSRQVRTPFYMWLDTDDDIENPGKIRDLVKVMEEQEADAMFLPYHYGYNDQGELIAEHWRERIIRTAHPFKWKGVVHETLISDSAPRQLKNDEVIIKHQFRTEAETIEGSGKRNHRILEKAYKDGDEDPRILYYLGRSHFTMKNYKDAAKILLKYTEVSGWDEQRYDAWMKIADSLLLMDSYDNAINALLEAVKLMPRWAEAYLRLGDLYLRLEQPVRAIEWLKAGISKPKPDTLEIIDPTVFTYKPLVSLAMAYFAIADVDKAKAYIDEAAKFGSKHPYFKNAFDSITSAKIEEDTIKSAAWLGKVVQEKGHVKKYFDGLPGFIKNDLRLRPLLVEAYPPRKWKKDEIAIYCGEQWEEWGPDTLDKGMGGSEEAITYLAPELAKLGYKVTVFNQRVEELNQDGVSWKPWETFNPEDEFNIFVAWRSPWMAQKLRIKAKISAVDMHDTPMGHQSIAPKALEHLDFVFFKSEFQRKMGEDVPDWKAVVIPNGIVPKQFDLKVKRNPLKVIYASSADRGFDVLLELWPEIKKQVPKAELVWPYGWNSYDALHKGDQQHAKWKWDIVKKMSQVGAKQLGRLSHEDLAKEFASSGVWAYPTSFPEIDCITAKKAQAGGCTPVTSGYAALQESVLEDEEEITDIHEQPDKLKEFVDRVVKALKEPETEEVRSKRAKKVLDTYGWNKIALKWKEVLCQKLDSQKAEKPLSANATNTS